MTLKIHIIFIIIALLSVGCDDDTGRTDTAIVLPDTLNLVIMSTTDVHGWVMPWDYYNDSSEERFSLVKAATLIDSIRNEHDFTLLLDAGDWLQGNPFAEYYATVDTTQPYPFLQAVDYLNYDAVVLGNHEFDFSIDLLEKRIEETKTPIIGANMYHHNTDIPVFTPYILASFGELTVGVIGLNTPGTAVWNRPRVEGRIDFVDGADAAKRFVPKMITEGADVIIALAHTGLEGGSTYGTAGIGEENFGRELGETVSGIDHIVLGHHHRVIENKKLTGPDGRDVGIVMAGGRASHLGVSKLTLAFDDALNRWTVIDQQSEVLPVAHAEQHSGLVELVKDAHERVREYVNQPIAHTPARWSAARGRIEDTPIIDLIQHVQMKVTGADISQAAVFDTGVEFGPGNISLRQIAQLYPYENTLYLLEVTGNQVRDYLEYTSQYYLQPERGQRPPINPNWPGYNFDMLAGVEYTLDLRNPVGERVVELTRDGEPVSDDDVFTMAVNSYRAAGGGGFDMIAGARVLEEIDISVRSMIVDFLKEKGEIKPEDVFSKNWRMLPDM
jgi:2',3'-cyclic-nucleotide 2'-phosphodiesterase / 3'-nucleotidase